MDQLTKDDLKLVLDAARQHYKNDQNWKSVPGLAYFEANLRRAQNRTNLGEAINRLEKNVQGHNTEQ